MIEYWCDQCRKYTLGKIVSDLRNYDYIQCRSCGETIARKPKDMKQ